MARYEISAYVTVQVVMDVEASSAEDARKLWDDNIALNAVMVDLPTDKWDVSEDVILDVPEITISRVED